MGVIITNRSVNVSMLALFLFKGSLNTLYEGIESILQSPVKEFQMPEVVAVVKRSSLSALMHRGGPTTSSKVNWTCFNYLCWSFTYI